MAACVHRTGSHGQCCQYVGPDRPSLSPETRLAFAACRRALTYFNEHTTKMRDMGDYGRAGRMLRAAINGILKAEGKEKAK